MDYDRLRELQEKFEENPRRYFAPLANEYRKGGQPKRAIEICRSQLAQLPGHMSGQIVYAQSLYECGEFDEARQVFERALTLDPENLIALRSLGDMSLQAGETAQARKWYSRLLDADPKDMAVIALVTEIDESAEAAPVDTPQEIPGVDADGGDQAIPYLTNAEGGPIGAEGDAGAAPAVETAPSSQPVEVERTADPASATESVAAAESASATESAPAAESASAPESASAIESTPAPEEVAAYASTSPSAGSIESPPEGLERHYPTDTAEPTAAAASTDAEAIDPVAMGLPDEGLGAEGLRGSRQDEMMGADGLHGNEAAFSAQPMGAEGLVGNAPPQALAGATSARSDDEDALDTWTPPPGATVHEQNESSKEVKMFSGPGPEPFVNETMAQLYLQQGYRQLALRVYYQLVESRPDDQALKDRIAEIEAADQAAHADTPVRSRREEPSIDRPAREPAAPQVPSVDPPDTGGSPIDHPMPVEPLRRNVPSEPPEREAPEREAPDRERETPDREPAVREAPAEALRARETVREEPAEPALAREPQRAERETIVARQPSVREFFATLGRRRPPRSAGSPGPAQRPVNNIPADTVAPLGNAAPSASLDAVFAGATVSQADSRAASRLAGAFSGATGAARPTPPTPPMPTPRVNQRVPQAQESEEDVAKFRAWLDGLTGE